MVRLKRGIMGGKRLGSFRAGDRSEYLAIYSLSRFAFVNTIPRQEDFGVVDLLCVLTKEEQRCVYPESAFYVQVKSTEDDVPFTEDDIKWISDHMDHPLFLCVVDKDANYLKIYSCWSIWRALFLRRYPKELTLLLNTSLPLQKPDKSETEDEVRFRVPVGPPVLSKSIKEIEEDPESVYTVMRDWVAMDARNIARKHMGRIAVTGIVNWTTNTAPTAEDSIPPIENRYFFGPNYWHAERELTPVLTALAHNYRDNGQREKLEAVCALLNVLRDYLDPHGLKFADGKLSID